MTDCQRRLRPTVKRVMEDFRCYHDRASGGNWASGYGVYAGERQNLNPIFWFSRPKFETSKAMYGLNR